MAKIIYTDNKILSKESALRIIAGWRVMDKTIAFTNGCFDILHRGHIYSLTQAAKEADYLVVGLNSDASVKRLKGESRPVNDEHSRAQILSSLMMVDAVVIFEEDIPLDLINTLKPDVLVKGGDYTVDQIAGAREVIGYGGKVVLNPILEGFSTSAIIRSLNK